MAKTVSSVEIDGKFIRYYTTNEDDYISLTDIAKNSDERTDMLISNWLRNRNTLEFLGVWESLNNPLFNPIEFDGIKSKAGLNSFILSVKELQEKTNAIGIAARAGRYGGTYAHRDIALEFCSWISPGYKLYVIREFQRLKAEEAERSKGLLDWNLKRTLSKVNYHFHTDAVRQHLIPPRIAEKKQAGIVYASEADLLNIALFGVTAKQWQMANPTLSGNIRDHATAEQLLVLANLENLNAHLINEGLSQDERAQKLNEVAIYQLLLLSGKDVLNGVKQLPQ